MESLWPCRPAVERRTVRLAGGERTMALHACSTGNVRFALAVVQVGDPAQVSAVATELWQSLASNLGAAATAPDASPSAAPSARAATAWTVPGATPNPAAGRFVLRGRSADGRPLAAELGLFVIGTTVLQPIAVGETVAPDVAETFLASFAVAG